MNIGEHKTKNGNYTMQKGPAINIGEHRTKNETYITQIGSTMNTGEHRTKKKGPAMNTEKKKVTTLYRKAPQ